MQMMKGACGRHETTICELTERLMSSGKYDSIRQHVEYYRKRLCGEVDILAYRTSNNTYYFFEIKCTNNHKNYKKAKEQYQRYVKAHPSDRVLGIYYTPTRVRLLRN